MGGFNLGSIIPTLIGQARAADMATAQEENNLVDQDVAMYHHLIMDPTVPPQLKGPAIQRTMDILEDHGGDIEDENKQKIGQILTGLAKSSTMQHAQTRMAQMQGAQGLAERLQKIRDAAGFTSPVPPGLQDPNMTIESGDQAAPAEAVAVGDVPRTTRPFTPPTSPPPAQPDLSSVGLGPEANATPDIPDVPSSLRTLAGLPPSPAPGQPAAAPSQDAQTRQKMNRVGPPTTVPYTPPQKPIPPPGPAMPLPPQPHPGLRQKIAGGLQRFAAGMEGYNPWAQQRQLEIQAQAQQQAQRREISQRWYLGQQFGLTGEELRNYAITGNPYASGVGAAGTSRLTEFILPDGSTIQLEYDPKTHKAYGPSGEQIRIPSDWKFGTPEKAPTGEYAQLLEAYKDAADPNAPEWRRKAAEARIAENKAKVGETGAPPGYVRGGPSLANPNMNPGVEGAATTFLVTGAMPALGLSKGDIRTRILERAGELRVNWGLDPLDIQPLQTLAIADRRAFIQINTQDHAIGQLETTLAKNMDLAKRLSAAYQRGDIQLINRVRNAIKTGKGDDEALNLAAQLHGVAVEWAKIMEGGALSAAGVKIGSAEAAESLISDRMGNGQLTSLFDNVITKDAENRREAISGEKQKIMNELRDPAKVFGGTSRFGAGGAGGGAGEPPTITTQDEYDALPVGTRYRDAHTGQIGTKRKQ